MNANVNVEWLLRAAFALAGAIHLLPMAGVLGRATLERAYGVTITSNDLLILMQHRALLFGLLSAACWIAVWQPLWRAPVAIAALVSMLSFVVIAWPQSPNAAIMRVVWIDAAASTAMGAALLVLLKNR
jgi:hypothetical protein